MTTLNKNILRKRVKLAVRNIYRLHLKNFILGILKIQRRLFINRKGINLIGYFSSAFGVAEVGRFFAKQAVQIHLPFSITNIHAETHTSLSDREVSLYRPYFNRWSNYYKNIFFINADEIVKYHNRKTELFTGRYNAAVFFWEFDDYFHFPEALGLLDEAIAFTDFVATAIRKSAPPGLKVTKLTFPFVKTWEIVSPPQLIKNKYAVPADDFVFFFNFDFRSIYERKNPAAILKAMDAAFSGQDAVTLILKTLHAAQKGDCFNQFQASLSEMKLNSKVVLINENLERNEMMSIINASDAYISLHRSEGLGLGMMEAMSMGKPVIGTAFGGNLDFMNVKNALLVDYKLIPLKQDDLPYKKGWLWAEPDIKMAAAFMRKLYDDRSFAFRLGQKGQNDIETKYSKAAFSKQMLTWLNSKQG